MSANEERFVPPDAAALADESPAPGPTDPPPQGAAGQDVAQTPGGAESVAWEVLARRREALMAIDGVVMVGIGSNEIGNPAIVVGVKRPDQLRKLPASVEGVPVRPQLIGEVDAYTNTGKRRK